MEDWNPRTIPLAKRVADWDTSIAGLVEEDVQADTVPVLIQILESQLARASVRMERTDTKAALVLPAIGILAGVIGPNVHRSPFDQDSPWLFTAAAIVVIFAGLSVVLAVWAIRPVEMSNGPLADKVVLAADDTLHTARGRYLGRLGFAVVSTEYVANWKAKWFVRSIGAGGISVLGLGAFIAAGGMA